MDKLFDTLGQFLAGFARQIHAVNDSVLLKFRSEETATVKN